MICSGPNDYTLGKIIHFSDGRQGTVTKVTKTNISILIHSKKSAYKY